VAIQMFALSWVASPSLDIAVIRETAQQSWRSRRSCLLDCFALLGAAMTVDQLAAPTASEIVSRADRGTPGHALTSASFVPVEGAVLAGGRVLLKA
jgi:hypothetical protein